MFKVSYNRAILRFRLETVTPLAIRAGETGLDPTTVDLTCVRTHHVQHGTTVYIPGSSLKGVVRSAAEAAVRGLTFRHLGGQETIGACDPLDHRASCARYAPRGREQTTTSSVHRSNCLACRAFGSLSIKGRCALRDLFPFSRVGELSDADRSNLERANRVELRHGIAINRISGAVAGTALFEQEVIPVGVRFHGEATLHNYQAWQLGLLLSVFDELDQGFAQLGSSKSRGQGVVSVTPLSFVHEQRTGTDPTPKAVGDLVDDDTRRDYGLFAEHPLPEALRSSRGLSSRFEIDPGQLGAWREAGLEALEQLHGVSREIR